MPPIKRRIRNAIIVVASILILAFLFLTWRLNMPFGSVAWNWFLLSVIFVGIGGVLLGLFFVRLIYSKSDSHANLSQQPRIMQYIPTSRVISTEFELNADDLIAFRLYDYDHSPRAKRGRILRLIILGAFGIILALGIILILISSKDQFIFISGVVTIALSLFLLLWLLLSPFILRLVLKRNLAKVCSADNGIHVKHVISITNEELTDITSIYSGKIPWKEISHIILTDKYLYFYERSTADVHIVPRAAFSDTTAFEQFVATARTYFAQASHG
jgi:hypothetical protein